MNIFAILAIASVVGGFMTALALVMIVMFGVAVGLWSITSPIVDRLMSGTMGFMAGGILFAMVLGICAVIYGVARA